MIGTEEVKKGELKFDSIAERGTDCALGPANLTQSRYYGSYSVTNPSTRDIVIRWGQAHVNPVGTRDAAFHGLRGSI